MMCSRHRSDRGAIAVIFAICAVLLFSVAALGVDLGNAFNRKRQTQTQADFAALAGASDLGEGNTKTPGDPAVVAVADYLNANQPQYDATVTPSITADQLVDGDNTNGEVDFIGTDRMRVITPPSLVRFGLAAVMGFSTSNVRGIATVKIVSAGGVMPFYAASGCDYGEQSIANPPPSASGPNLAFSGDNGNAHPTSISPNHVALNQSPVPGLDVYGDTFTGGAADASYVGFFKNDGTTFDEVPVTPIDGTHIHVGAIPSSVINTETTWYVRVYKNNKWSPVASALPLQVGGAVLECVGGASAGNFGSLLLPRTDSNNSASGGWLPINIAKGLQPPLTLTVLDGASSPWTCDSTTTNAVLSDTSPANLVPKTNCIATDTGLTDTSATAGFIKGGSNGGLTYTGRLDVDTTPGCGADSANPDARWDTGISGPSGDYKINDDLLTCFFTNSTTSISTITTPSYSGPPVLSPDIYNSPRFFFQPVLGTVPTNGGSTRYSIIDFRPGFITDEGPDATKAIPTFAGETDHNGLSIAGGKISKVNVIFFDVNALPPPSDDSPTIDYLGYGPKGIRLVN